MQDLSVLQYLLVTIISALTVKLIVSPFRYFREREERKRLFEYSSTSLNKEQCKGEQEETPREQKDPFSPTHYLYYYLSERYPAPEFSDVPFMICPETSFLDYSLPEDEITRIVRKIADPIIEHLSLSSFHAMCMLILISRCRDLILREYTLKPHLRNQVVKVLRKLTHNRDQVEDHLESLLAAHARCQKPPAWPKEIRMQDFDLEDFNKLLSRYNFMANAEMNNVDMELTLSAINFVQED